VDVAADRDCCSMEEDASCVDEDALSSDEEDVEVRLVVNVPINGSGTFQAWESTLEIPFAFDTAVRVVGIVLDGCRYTLARLGFRFVVVAVEREVGFSSW
jgi:hypothetical protein